MITLLAPYGRNEVTSAAIRLAELVMSLGQKVRLVACGVHEKAVHPFWDERVVRGDRGDAIPEAASKSMAVVHFQAHQLWLDRSSLVSTANHRVKQILVPNWHGMAGKEAALITRYDQVVCPSRTCKQAIQAEVFRGAETDKDRLTWCRWDAGLTPVRREGTVADNKLKACVYADAATVDFCGPMVIALVSELLAMFPKLEVSIVSAKSWARRDRAGLTRIVRAAGGRLRVVRLAGLFDLTKEFHAHDWALLPSVRADFGMAAARALACGVPVICNDVAPFDEIVWAANGVLVPCEVRTGAAKAPLAVPALASWVKSCTAALRDTRKLFCLQTLDWKLCEQQAAFNNAWRHALDT